MNVIKQTDMEEKKKPDYIDLRLICQRIWQNRKKYYIVMPIAFVVSALYSLCIPRFYITDTTVVPEMENSGMSGTLGSLASSFGFDLSDMQTSDAITPLLYPDLMEDNGFVANLLAIRVKSAADADVQVDTTYYAYLKKYQLSPWWSKASTLVKKQLAPKKKMAGGKGKKYDPYYISEDDNDIMEAVRNNVTIGVDKKTAVISIGVKAQDPYICKQLADSIRERLQVYITNYRTNKARVDVAYYEQLSAEAKSGYEKIRRRYGSFSDSNTDVILESVRATQEDMENEMQLRYNQYSMIQTQLQAARAKVQERTPAFTLLKVPQCQEGTAALRECSWFWDFLSSLSSVSPPTCLRMT